MNGRTTAPLLLLAVLAGCTSGPDKSTADGAYLDRVHTAARDTGSGITGYGDTRIIELGRAVCDDLTAGTPPGDIAAGLAAQDTPGVSRVAGPLVGAANAHLCPDVTGA